jgi:hypothetical protein
VGEQQRWEDIRAARQVSYLARRASCAVHFGVFIDKKLNCAPWGFFLDKAEKTGHHRSLASHLMEGDGNAEGKFSFSEETVLHGSWHCNYKVFGLESAYCF